MTPKLPFLVLLHSSDMFWWRCTCRTNVVFQLDVVRYWEAFLKTDLMSSSSLLMLWITILITDLTTLPDLRCLVIYTYAISGNCASLSPESYCAAGSLNVRVGLLVIHPMPLFTGICVENPPLFRYLCSSWLEGWAFTGDTTEGILHSCYGYKQSTMKSIYLLTQKYANVCSDIIT